MRFPHTNCPASDSFSGLLKNRSVGCDGIQRHFGICLRNRFSRCAVFAPSVAMGAFKVDHFSKMLPTEPNALVQNHERGLGCSRCKKPEFRKNFVQSAGGCRFEVAKQRPSQPRARKRRTLKTCSEGKFQNASESHRNRRCDFSANPNRCHKPSKAPWFRLEPLLASVRGTRQALGRALLA